LHTKKRDIQSLGLGGGTTS